MGKYFVLLIIFSCHLSTAQITLQGKAIKIVDGDTFDLLINKNETVRIRLSDIDCPERKQDYYAIAKKALAGYVIDKVVKVIYSKKDRNGRILGTIFIAEQNINLRLVEDGLAWHFVKYSKDKRFALAEKMARAAKKGIWSLENPIAPWDFRRQH